MVERLYGYYPCGVFVGGQPTERTAPPGDYHPDLPGGLYDDVLGDWYRGGGVCESKANERKRSDTLRILGLVAAGLIFLPGCDMNGSKEVICYPWMQEELRKNPATDKVTEPQRQKCAEQRVP